MSDPNKMHPGLSRVIANCLARWVVWEWCGLAGLLSCFADSNVSETRDWPITTPLQNCYSPHCPRGSTAVWNTSYMSIIISACFRWRSQSYGAEVCVRQTRLQSLLDARIHQWPIDCLIQLTIAVQTPNTYHWGVRLSSVQLAGWLVACLTERWASLSASLLRLLRTFFCSLRDVRPPLCSCLPNAGNLIPGFLTKAHLAGWFFLAGLQHARGTSKVTVCLLLGRSLHPALQLVTNMWGTCASHYYSSLVGLLYSRLSLSFSDSNGKSRIKSEPCWI